MRASGQRFPAASRSLNSKCRAGRDSVSGQLPAATIPSRIWCALRDRAYQQHQGAPIPVESQGVETGPRRSSPTSPRPSCRKAYIRERRGIRRAVAGRQTARQRCGGRPMIPQLRGRVAGTTVAGEGPSFPLSLRLQPRFPPAPPPTPPLRTSRTPFHLHLRATIHRFTVSR